MGLLNYVIGIFTAVLVIVGVKKGTPKESHEKKSNVQISTQHGQVKKKFDPDSLKSVFNYSEEKPKNKQKLKSKPNLAMEYEKYSQIRFRPEFTFWKDSKIQMQFFPQGHLYQEAITLHEVQDGYQTPIHYQTSYFQLPPDINMEKFNEYHGFSGFKFFFPINQESQAEEFAVFQGASYFRVVSRGQVYGLSARGLALNTGIPQPEEFPVFKEFWIEKPKSKADKVSLYAHLESPSAEGIYKFHFSPGEPTTTEVNFETIMKKDVVRLGIAPLTSMFWYGESTPSLIPPYPESHDSDGLLILDKDQFFWIPLENPKKPTNTTFPVKNLKGFGLLQKDREFSSYEDSRYDYHKRPGAWVEPMDEWGEGTITLYRIPTKDDLMDNIVVYFTPERLPAKGEKIKYSYNIKWISKFPYPNDFGEVISTRFIHTKDKNIVNFIIEFKGLDFKNIEDKKIRFHLEDEDIEILENTSTLVNEGEKLRINLKLSLKSKEPENLILSGYLEEDSKKVSEKWNYILD